MILGSKLAIAVVAAVLGAPMASAFAQNGSTTMPSASDHRMSMGKMRHGMMSGSMMAGCAEMMQSMNNGGNGKPNSQWQTHPRRHSDNGG